MITCWCFNHDTEAGARLKEQIRLLERLPKRFYARLQRAAKKTEKVPERVMDESLKLFEGKYGLAILEDPELVKRVLTQHHSKVGARVASDMTQEQRQSRATLGGYGKAARRLGISVDEYLKRRESEAKKS